MAKENGKRLRRKGKKVDQPNAKIKKKARRVSKKKAIAPDEAIALDPEKNSNEGSSQGKEKEIQKSKRISGFIFMCNPTTKLECYQYRVFGLPMGQKGLVEEITPGSKLFLYDFELKLLYGIYEATSIGKLNLEPAAFNGRYPAQVKFKIFKECLPMPESALRHAIMENYAGSKFKQELNRKQVKKLLSLFHPLTASSGQSAPQAVANVALPRAMPPLAFQNQFEHIPYIPQPVHPQTIPRAKYLQHGYNRTAAYVERVPPILHHQTTRSHYVANSQQPSFFQDVAHGLQQPPYSSHRVVEERPSHEQLSTLERYRLVEPRTSHDQVTNLSRDYLHIPLHRETLYQNNASQYTSSVPQSQDPSPYRPLPLYQDDLGQAQYASSAGLQPQAPVQAQYASAIMQPEGPSHYQTVYQNNVGGYSSYRADPVQYTSSVTHTERLAPPGVSQGSAHLVPSYYSYDHLRR